jgi:hypothetical protein
MLVFVHLSSILFVLLNLFVKDSLSEIRLKLTDLTRILRLTSSRLVVEAYYVLEVFFCNRYTDGPNELSSKIVRLRWALYGLK